MPDSSRAKNPVGTVARDLVERSLIIDAAGALLKEEPHLWPRYSDGQADVVLATITTEDDVTDTVSRLSRWNAILAKNADRLASVRNSSSLDKATLSDKLGVCFHFQNGAMLRRDPWLVNIYSQLGVRVIQLTYNWRNHIGDGCLEPLDSGLSDFGKSVVTRMNKCGVVVDLSHTGVRTTLDAMEHSELPDVFTHANARAVYDHPRNLTDEQIRAVAVKDGVVGICSFCAFLGSSPTEVTLRDFVDQIDYIAQLVGSRHVGLGLDLYNEDLYHQRVESGQWDPKMYPKPPWSWPLDGTNYHELVQALLDRGYRVDDIAGILGGNFRRVFSTVWDSAVPE